MKVHDAGQRTVRSPLTERRLRWNRHRFIITTRGIRESWLVRRRLSPATLGHTKLESTVRYPGIEVDDALEIAEQTEV
jgi:hypothetical protein